MTNPGQSITGKWGSEDQHPPAGDQPSGTESQYKTSSYDMKSSTNWVRVFSQIIWVKIAKG
jgi:hypothetical protein